MGMAIAYNVPREIRLRWVMQISDLTETRMRCVSKLRFQRYISAMHVLGTFSSQSVPLPRLVVRNITTLILKTNVWCRIISFIIQ